MVNLRRHINKDTPIVFQSTWELQHERGWRWAKNLTTEERHELETIADIKDYQHIHGEHNVALGHPWDHTQHSPVAPREMSATVQLVGMYVRDVDQLIDKLKNDLEDWHSEC